jgi:hypothetical protein
VRAIDGLGRPPPWPDGPRKEVRVLPPGKFGEITWGKEGATEPYFFAESSRGMGYGVSRYPTDKGAVDKTRAVFSGPLSYTGVGEGEGGRLVYDKASGTLDGSTELRATAWTHAEAAPIADGSCHAFRAKAADDDENTGAKKGDEQIVFLLAETVLGLSSRSTRVAGGFFPSRFSRSWSYTTYTMPASPGTSGFTTYFMPDHDEKRWFRRPPGAEKNGSRSVALSVSQTSAEPEPSVRVLVFKGVR